MNRGPRILITVLLGTSLICALVVGCTTQKPRSETDIKRPTACVGDSEFVIRFVYFRTPTDVYPHPRLLRVAGHDSPQLATAPLNPRIGYSLFITQPEMDAVAQKLEEVANWSPALGYSGMERDVTLDASIFPANRLHVTASCSRVSAIAVASTEEKCRLASAVLESVQTPRALWEFKLFVQTFSCPVTDFDPDAYPER